jgi:hypothetical protein
MHINSKCNAGDIVVNTIPLVWSQVSILLQIKSFQFTLTTKL